MVSDKKEGKAWDKWNAITAYEVDNLDLSQRPRIILVVECQVNIDGHGQRPIGITLHEPGKSVNGLHD